MLASSRHRTGATAAAVLSPHFDDAVFSCWHLLRAARPLTVVNVFAGVPPQGSRLGRWDRLTGADDAVVRAHQRADEDRIALALAGRVPVNLDLLEAQYRSGGQSPSAIAGRIARVVDRCDVVYAPAALGRHPDHALVRGAALCLRSLGVRVRLYADLPHAIRRGWPTWVASDGTPAADGRWSRALARISRRPLQPCVHILDSRERDRKLAALRVYGTQLAKLEATFGPIERTLGYEVDWELDPA